MRDPGPDHVRHNLSLGTPAAKTPTTKSPNRHQTYAGLRGGHRRDQVLGGLAHDAVVAVEDVDRGGQDDGQSVASLHGNRSWSARVVRWWS